MRKHGLILLLMLFSICAMAQKVTINAKVIDKSDKEPLIGATVIAMGTSNGTITDFDGNQKQTKEICRKALQEN